jgi:pimeloyl-ACP methyl ester carboxylesterase
MSYLAELADLVLLHARAQGVGRARCRDVLGRIERVEGDAPGSWCREWTVVADRMAGSGRHLAACRLYNLARFPYPAGQAQLDAGRRAVSCFDRWRTARGDLHRLEPMLRGQRVPVWVGGLDPARPRPLLLVMGGIVSVKEQWAQAVARAAGLGMAVVLTELPGVGENPLPYDGDSWRMLPGLIDAIDAIAPVQEVYAIGMSFGGHLVLRAAPHDSRLRGLATVGAPVRAFFRDTTWWSGVPETTKRTLAHITGVPVPDVHGHLRDLALRPDELAAVQMPVRYVVSSRDEIVPAEEPRVLMRHVEHFASVEFDDVHGSPKHVSDTVLWILRSLLQMRAGPRLPLAALDLALGIRALARRML